MEPEIVSILEPGFTVKVADRNDALLALGLGGVDLVVGLDDRFDEPADGRGLAAVEAWVRRGGVLLLVHNGICWAKEPGWFRLAGGRFTGHGPAQVLTFTRRDNGGSFDLFEEPYRFAFPFLGRKTILADYGDGGRRWPAAWTRKLGKGRVVYAVPGHGVEAFRQPEYRRWLAGWAQGGIRPS